MVAKESGISRRDCGIRALSEILATTGKSKATAATLFMKDEKKTPRPITNATFQASLFFAKRKTSTAKRSVIPVVDSAVPSANIENIATTTGEEKPENACSGVIN